MMTSAPQLRHVAATAPEAQWKPDGINARKLYGGESSAMPALLQRFREAERAEAADAAKLRPSTKPAVETPAPATPAAPAGPRPPAESKPADGSRPPAETPPGQTPVRESLLERLHRYGPLFPTLGDADRATVRTVVDAGVDPQALTMHLVMERVTGRLKPGESITSDGLRAIADRLAEADPNSETAQALRKAADALQPKPVEPKPGDPTPDPEAGAPTTPGAPEVTPAPPTGEAPVTPTPTEPAPTTPAPTPDGQHPGPEVVPIAPPRPGYYLPELPEKLLNLLPNGRPTRGIDIHV